MHPSGDGARRPSPRASGRGFGASAAAATAATLGFLAVLVFAHGRTLIVVDDLGELAAAWLAAAACWRRAQSDAGRLRVGWVLLGGSAFAWGLGEVAWSYYELLKDVEAPFPSSADIGFLLAVPLGIAAMLAFFSPPVGWMSRLRLVVDASVIVSAALFVSWFLLLGPMVHQGEGSRLAQAIGIAYPAGDVLIISMVLLVGGRSGSGDGLPLGWISCGLAALALSDTGFAYLTLKGTYASGVVDAGWFAGFLMLALAARRVPAGDRRARELTAVPYLPVVGVAALIVGRFASGGELSGFLLADLGLVVAFVVARQILTLAENRTLTDGLEAMVRVRTLELHHSEGRLRSLVSNISDVVSIVSGDGTVRYMSPSIRLMFGYEPHNVVDRSVFEILHPDDRPMVEAFLAGDGRPGGRLHVRMLHTDGTWRHVEAVGADMRDDASLGGFVFTTRDVTEHRELEAQLLHQAFHEPLTGLANRTLFGDRTDQALARVRRTGRDLAVAFVDLDEFKLVNDTLGHAAGDALLVQVASRLVDIVRPGDTVARMGGDEFAILLEEADETVAVAIVERIAAAVALPFDIAGRDIRLTASIGLASSSADTASADDLLRDADVAMYRAKAGGKAQHQLFHVHMREAVADRAEMLVDLRHALELNQLAVHYQPLIELGTNRLAGFEALCRWFHPTRGVIPPVDFIPLAEESGIIVSLGDWVLATALSQLSAWDQLDRRDPPLTMSVNLSIRQVNDPGLIGRIAALLAASDVHPSRITLEMTESILAEDAEGMIGRVAKLKELGVRLAIDDFGTGFSSLSYLRRFPVDSIKIDKSFVDDLGSSRGQDLVRTLVQLGKVLGLDTVAEGIEEPGQSAALLALGCRLGQGYQFSRPLTGEAAAAAITAASKNEALAAGQHYEPRVSTIYG